jgi:hypothetical protein
MREFIDVLRITFRARRDARVGIHEPENNVIAVIKAPPEAFDAATNIEHRRLQQQRNRTSRLEELREEERSTVGGRFRKSKARLAALVALILADAFCAAQLLHTTLSFGPGPSALLGIVFSVSFVWLVSLTQRGAARWLAIGVTMVAVLSLVVLRLQSLAADEASTTAGNVAAAVIFALLTIGPAMLGERIARQLREDHEHEAAAQVSHALVEGEEKDILDADKKVRTTITSRAAYDRLFDRLIAVYDREWKLERARLELD